MTRRTNPRERGTVQNKTPWITVEPVGGGVPVEFAIDTGFNSSLSATRATLRGWSLTAIGKGTEVLGHGGERSSRVYSARIRWLGKERVVSVSDVGGGDPVLGFDLLRNTRITLRDDAVEVEALPEKK